MPTVPQLSLFDDPRLCSKCKVPKPSGDFGKDKNRKDGLNCWCRLCVSRDPAKTLKNAYLKTNGLKECVRCCQDLPLSEFYPRGKNGYQSRCKPCHNKRAAEWQRQKDKANPEAAAARRHRDYVKYDHVTVKRKYREENRDAILARRRAAYAANPQENINATLRRMALRRGSTNGSHTVAEWEALCRRYDNRCVCCYSSAKLTRDHIVALTDGGTDDIANIQPLCGSCNSRKQAKHINYRPDRLIAGLNS